MDQSTGSLKRKSGWRYDHLPRLALYQDDVQSLYDLFSARFRRIDLSAGGYQLPDVASLGRIGRKPLHNFSVRGDGLGVESGGWAAVTIAPMYVQIVVSDDQDVELLGIATAAREILMGRVQRVAHWVIAAAPVLAWGAFAIALALGLARVGLDKTQWTTVILIAFTIAFVVTVVAGQLRLRSHGTLYPFLSTSTQSWWDRNRDAVVTQLLAGLIGGLVLLAFELALGVLRLPGQATPAP
jgi:hypothetical protein